MCGEGARRERNVEIGREGGRGRVVRPISTPIQSTISLIIFCYAEAVRDGAHTLYCSEMKRMPEAVSDSWAHGRLSIFF